MPIDADNGELQPDPEREGGGTAEHREDGRRIECHNRPITNPVDPAATRPDPDPSPEGP